MPAKVGPDGMPISVKTSYAKTDDAPGHAPTGAYGAAPKPRASADAPTQPPSGARDGNTIPPSGARDGSTIPPNQASEAGTQPPADMAEGRTKPPQSDSGLYAGLQTGSGVRSNPFDEGRTSPPGGWNKPDQGSNTATTPPPNVNEQNDPERPLHSSEHLAPAAQPTAAPAERKTQYGGGGLFDNIQQSSVPAPNASAEVTSYGGGASSPQTPSGTQTQTQAELSFGQYAVGWLVVIDGPGKGHSITVKPGQSIAQRSADSAIPLVYGDGGITGSQKQFVITYAQQSNQFYITSGDGVSENYLNGQILLQPSELKSGDLIQCSQTTLRFVAFCDQAFKWD